MVDSDVLANQNIPFGCRKSPDSTPRFKASLKNRSKLVDEESTLLLALTYVLSACRLLPFLSLSLALLATRCSPEHRQTHIDDGILDHICAESSQLDVATRHIRHDQQTFEWSMR